MNSNLTIVKVRLCQNGFMKSSIFQKMTRKIWRISGLCTINTLIAEILQIFQVIFWKIDHFISSFWLTKMIKINVFFHFVSLSLLLQHITDWIFSCEVLETPKSKFVAKYRSATVTSYQKEYARSLTCCDEICTICFGHILYHKVSEVFRLKT